MITRYLKSTVTFGVICAAVAHAQINETVDVTTCDVPLDKSAYSESAKKVKSDVQDAIDQSVKNRTYLENEYKAALTRYEAELQNCKHDTDCSGRLAAQIKSYDAKYTEDLTRVKEQAIKTRQEVAHTFHCLYLRRWVGSMEERVQNIPDVRTLAIGHRFVADPTELNQLLLVETPSWKTAYEGVLKKAVLVRWIYERGGTIRQATILAGINRLATYSDFASRLDNPPEVAYKDESPILIGNLVYTRNNTTEEPKILTPDIFSRTPAAQWLVVPYLLDSQRLGRYN